MSKWERKRGGLIILFIVAIFGIIALAQASLTMIWHLFGTNIISFMAVGLLMGSALVFYIFWFTHLENLVDMEEWESENQNPTQHQHQDWPQDPELEGKD